MVRDPESGPRCVRVSVLHSLPADLASGGLHSRARGRIKRIWDGCLRAENGLRLDAGLSQGNPGGLEIPPEAIDLGHVTRVDLDKPPLTLIVVRDQAIAVKRIKVWGRSLKEETFGNRNWSRCS